MTRFHFAHKFLFWNWRAAKLFYGSSLLKYAFHKVRRRRFWFYLNIETDWFETIVSLKSEYQCFSSQSCCVGLVKLQSSWLKKDLCISYQKDFIFLSILIDHTNKFMVSKRAEEVIEHSLMTFSWMLIYKKKLVTSQNLNL